MGVVSVLMPPFNCSISASECVLVAVYFCTNNMKLLMMNGGGLNTQTHTLT